MAQSSKRARGEESDSISLVMHNTAAQVMTFPTGWEEVREEDKQATLQLMVAFHRAVEPNNPRKKWNIRPVISKSSSVGSVHSYDATYAGYTGVVRADVLVDFQRQHSSMIAYIGFDPTFVSADRANSGAIVINIYSQSTISQSIHRHEESPGAVVASTSYTAHEIMPTIAVAQHSAAGYPAMRTNIPAAAAAIPEAQVPVPAAASPPSTRASPPPGLFSRLFTSKLLGLGDGEDN